MARSSRWLGLDGEFDVQYLGTGSLAGIAGGVAGAWMMNQYHARVSNLVRSEQANKTQGGREKAGHEVGHQSDQEAPAMGKAASAAVTGSTGHKMNKQERQAAGLAMRYAFGAAMGGIYGAVAEASPRARFGLGAPYGAGVWLAADEVAVPALGLARPPLEHPPSTHIHALVSHLVSGLTLEVVRRAVRAVL